MNVKYRDVRFALPFAIQLWMFATPIIYPSSIVPPRWRWVLLVNPAAGLVDAFRAAVFNRDFDWGSLGASAGMTVVLLLLSLIYFQRMEKSFADLV